MRPIGRESRARKRGWGNLGERRLFPTLKGRTLFLAVIIGLSPNYVDSFIFRKIITSRSSGTMPVRMTTEMMHFNRLIIMVVAMASVAICVWRY